MTHTYRIGDRVRIINSTHHNVEVGELGTVVSTEIVNDVQRLQVRILRNNPSCYPIWDVEWVLAACVILADK